jgi:3-methylfumaryl-CoA hydratase
MGEWDAWIGRSAVHADRIDPALAKRWCATLDRPLPDQGLAPQGLHWCLGVPDAPTATLGPDGHPRRNDSPDGFLPPIPLPRRMWAASEVRFHAPLVIGSDVVRQSQIRAIIPRQGASGALVFVELAHETRDCSTLLVSEVQTVVYRAAPSADALPVPPPPGTGHFDAAAWTTVRTIDPAPPLLFRYSALTFNSHRIHYDQAYATGVEGYRGLVVHGPLIASLLLDLARRHLGDNRLATFRFRAVSPALCGEPLHLALREDNTALILAAFADDGRPVMDARAEIQLKAPIPASP